jgi:hypothetical protein
MQWSIRFKSVCFSLDPLKTGSYQNPSNCPCGHDAQHNVGVHSETTATEQTLVEKDDRHLDRAIDEVVEYERGIEDLAGVSHIPQETSLCGVYLVASHHLIWTECRWRLSQPEIINSVEIQDTGYDGSNLLSQFSRFARSLD